MKFKWQGKREREKDQEISTWKCCFKHILNNYFIWNVRIVHLCLCFDCFVRSFIHSFVCHMWAVVVVYCTVRFSQQNAFTKFLFVFNFYRFENKWIKERKSRFIVLTLLFSRIFVHNVHHTNAHTVIIIIMSKLCAAYFQVIWNKGIYAHSSRLN